MNSDLKNDIYVIPDSLMNILKKNIVKTLSVDDPIFVWLKKVTRPWQA